MIRYKTALMAVALLLLWFLGSSFGAGVGGTDAQKELQKFQGTWVMVSTEMDGKKIADENVGRSKITFQGDKMQVLVPHQHAEMIAVDIVKIDPTRNPKEMHFVRRNGPNAGKTMIGIYEFEGDDQYKFAFDPIGARTLKEFTTKKGTGHIRNTWKRVNP